jgi:protein-disulfide isomerase
LAVLGFGGVIFRRDCGWAFLRWSFYTVVFGLAFDLYLAFIMILKIKANCWLCVITYLINMVVFIVLAIQLRREPRPRVSLKTIFPNRNDAQPFDHYYRNVIKGLLVGGIFISTVAVVAGTQFLSDTLTENDRERLAKIIHNLPRQKPSIVDVKDRPFFGAKDAELTVVEFSDFLCPYCAKASKYLKLAGSGLQDTAQFVFRHYPLDQSCNNRLYSNVHPGACMLAEGSACAHEQNKFWEYHDIAFDTKGKISRSAVMDIAERIGIDLGTFESCLDSGRGLEVVKEDIRDAINARVNSTPTLFINGRKFRGVPKPWMLEEILRFSQKNLSQP